MCLRFQQPGQTWSELQDKIKSNTQALNPDHLKVIYIWNMISEANERMEQYKNDLQIR